MIILYSWPTPDAQMVHIMLEECELPYQVTPVNIETREQFDPEFSLLSPDGKIPALVDTDGPDGKPITLSEAGTILLYLSGKTGQFLGHTTREKYQVMQWLMFQVGNLGPTLSQATYFRHSTPTAIPFTIEHYTNEARRLYGVINKQLSQSRYLAGDQYSLADIATYPWARNWREQGVEWTGFPHLRRWFEEVTARAAVQRGISVLSNRLGEAQRDEAEVILFGTTLYKKR